MMDFLRDDLKYKEIPSKQQKKIPSITLHGILHTFIDMYINIWSTRPKNIFQTFFWTKVWIQNMLPTYDLEIISKSLEIFFVECAPE